MGKLTSWCRHLVAAGVLALKLSENFDAYPRERPPQAALRRAFAEHDQNLPAYRANANDFLATLDPESEQNVRTYTEAIEALFART